MPCSVIRLPNGATAFVRHAAQRPRVCSACQRKVRDYRLCDGDIGRGKTCDAVVCRECATHKEPDIDFCPLHCRQAEGRLKL
jgi:hypothetical protein